jgi:anti-sigma factor RsiW
MSEVRPPFAEDELHAYVDGRLPEDRERHIAAWLTTAPEHAERVRAWQAQRAGLRSALSDPPPENPALSVPALLADRLYRARRSVWRPLAASILLSLALGGAAGWALRGRTLLHGADQPLALLEQEAAATHAVYAADRRHPIEVGADQREHLAQWLSNRLDRHVAPPELAQAGWHLLGGRLLATENGRPAALFMYADDHGQRLSVLMQAVEQGAGTQAAERQFGELNGAAWVAHGVGYAVIAAAPKPQIANVVRLIREQASA